MTQILLVVVSILALPVGCLVRLHKTIRTPISAGAAQPTNPQVRSQPIDRGQQ